MKLLVENHWTGTWTPREIRYRAYLLERMAPRKNRTDGARPEPHVQFRKTVRTEKESR